MSDGRSIVSNSQSIELLNKKLIQRKKGSWSVFERMTFYDTIVPSIMFVLGMMFTYSIERRRKKEGIKKALFYIMIRYFALLVLGYSVS